MSAGPSSRTSSPDPAFPIRVQSGQQEKGWRPNDGVISRATAPFQAHEWRAGDGSPCCGMLAAMQQTTTASADISETAILSRVVCSESKPLSREASRWILQIGFPEGDQARVKALTEKAQQGALTPEEDRTLEQYLHVGRILELMKSKARQRLRELGEAVPA